jgi:hypothetical protein
MAPDSTGDPAPAPGTPPARGSGHLHTRSCRSLHRSAPVIANEVGGPHICGS